MTKQLLTSFAIVALAGSAHAATVNLGDQTLNASSNDGWSSNSHVLSNFVAGPLDAGGAGPEIVYSYTNSSGGAELVTPLDFGYFVQGGAAPDFSTFSVTPFLVTVNGAAEGDYSVQSIGTTRVGGAAGDFNAVGAYSNPFGGTSFVLGDGETVAIGVIDSNADGTGPAHSPAGGVIPFDGGAGGDNNHWYNGDAGANTYPNGTPGGAGIGGSLSGVESADIDRNYQFNISIDVSAIPEPSASLLGLLGLGLVARRRR
ncbi:MAG: PEP-CTERM sorting domain-containing protein [Akkermansiaceae bacterium]